MIARRLERIREVMLAVFLAASVVWPAAARADEKEPAPEDGIFITVHNPITSQEMSRVKSATERAIERFRKSMEQNPRQARLKIVYDFNPDGKPSNTSQYEPCLGLAKYLMSLGGDFTTIAFVHQVTTFHTVLPVLACQEIVMASSRSGTDVRIGDVHPEDEDEISYYMKVTERRGRCPAIVMKMLDKNVAVLEGTRKGKLCYVEEKRLKEEEEKGFKPAPRAEPVISAGSPPFFTTEAARKFDLCNRILNTRQEVAEWYEMPRASLQGDPLEGRASNAWRIEVRGSMDRILKETVQRRFKQATDNGGNYLIIQLSCSGGDPAVAQGLAEFIRDLKDAQGRPVKTVAYVTRQARDTATFLALACNDIILEREASLGDFEKMLSHHPDLAGGMGQSLSALAEKRDYPPLLARGFVEKELAICQVKSRKPPHERLLVTEEDIKADQKQDQPKWGQDKVVIKPAGKLLKLDAKQAQALGFARHEVKNLDELYERCGLTADAVHQATPDWLDKLAAWLRDPTIAALLVMVGISCLILELKLPGVSLPGIISALCFVLFFWAHAQLAFTWLAILLFVMGLVLIALEIFVLPGFAVMGVSGILCLLAGLALATMEHWPHTDSEWASVIGNLGRFGLGLLGAVVIAVMVARYLPSIPYANRLVLEPPSDDPAGSGDAASDSTIQKLAAMLGAIGVAATDLRPAGMVRFSDDFVDVVTDGSYITAGARVQVIEIEGNRIVVKEV